MSSLSKLACHVSPRQFYIRRARKVFLGHSLTQFQRLQRQRDRLKTIFFIYQNCLLLLISSLDFSFWSQDGEYLRRNRLRRALRLHPYPHSHNLCGRSPWLSKTTRLDLSGCILHSPDCWFLLSIIPRTRQTQNGLLSSNRSVSVHF
jgi:hypothetical protein